MLVLFFGIVLLYVLCNKSGFMGSEPSGLPSGPSNPSGPDDPEDFWRWDNGLLIGLGISFVVLLVLFGLFTYV